MGLIKRNKEEVDYIRRATLLSLIPFLWIVSPIIGYIIGYYLDKILHTQDIFSIILLLMGIGAALRESIIIIRRVSKDT